MRSGSAHRSPYQVTYDDLVNSTKARIEWMEKHYPSMKLTNQITAYAATHNLEVEKAKLKLFLKFKKDPQANLFEEFERKK